jgi:Family of unknown function (DUF6653)
MRTVKGCPPVVGVGSTLADRPSTQLLGIRVNTTSEEAEHAPSGYTAEQKGYPRGRASLRSESAREHDVAILTEKTWKRHSNPWSVWTRTLTYPLVYLPFWNRSWKQGAAVAAWFAANPVIFPAPKDDSSWATRSVLGEQLWTAKRRRDFPMALNAASAVFFAGALLSAYRRRFWPMMFCAFPSLLLKLWFLDRMKFYYEQHRQREESPEVAEVATTPSSA